MQPTSHPFSPDPARKPTVLITHEYAPFRGGVATYVREVATAAERMGEAVTVWTVNHQGRGVGETDTTGTDSLESFAGFPVVRLRSSGRLTPGGLCRLAHEIWRRRADLENSPVVLLSVGAQMAFFLLAILGIRVGGRITCFFHGSEVLRFQRNPFWRALARRFYLRRAGGFAVTTRYVEDLLRTSGLVPQDAEIAMAPCALPSTFHVEHSSSVASRDENNHIFRILTVARLHPRKGQREVARALAILPPELRRSVIYQMVGVGEAGYREEVAEVCRVGEVRCEFLGAVDDAALGGIYARASVYAQASRILPQSVEGFGITFLEASAHGCPVAAWRSGGVNEAVLDGQTGLLVAEGDVTGLAFAIERLLKQADLRKQLGARGKTYVREFDWEKTARVIIGGQLPLV